MILLLASLWFVHPAPLDMPRAEAYFVKGADGALWLEDRFNVLDLWTSQAVLGRWEDDDGRRLMVAKLDVVPPAVNASTRTRADYARERVALSRKDRSFGDLRTLAVSRLAPFELTKQPAAPRQQIRGMAETLYYQGTNHSAIVCAFLPESSRTWYLATWELVAGDDFDYSCELFEEEFLAKWAAIVKKELRSEADGDAQKGERRTKEKAGDCDDRALECAYLRADARHSVTNYVNWHVTDAPGFTVLDDLPRDHAFVRTLTNDLPVLRAKYAAALPSPVDGTNVLCVARIFKDRDEYLDAVGEDMAWTAAYWSPVRRELVAYLPMEGADGLMKTIRHEAFHQYLSYACAMIAASPWLNEGYAVYFEDESSTDWALGGLMPDLDKLAEFLPTVLKMDYEQFYAGTASERRLKYRLAWSVAHFIEKGAPKVRFAPFKDLKKDYVAALLRHKDMALATAEAFRTREKLDQFIAEWKKFWQDM
ncbi:MAG: hypothetical protein ACI4R9_00365 [Kiritimatiellia bacterium]